jgi:penicillin amidase
MHQKSSKLGAQIFHGSNNWAVSENRTQSGKPMLANDMHLGFSIPGTWFQIHQVIPGS